MLLAIREKRLVFEIETEAGDPAGEFHLSLGPFRQVVKDYFQICESYFDAVKRLPPSQIEAIDMARRAEKDVNPRMPTGAVEVVWAPVTGLTAGWSGETARRGGCWQPVSARIFTRPSMTWWCRPGVAPRRSIT